MVSSIIETADSVNDQVAGSSPAGGAKTESNGALHGERCGEPDFFAPRAKEQSNGPPTRFEGYGQTSLCRTEVRAFRS